MCQHSENQQQTQAAHGTQLSSIIVTMSNEPVANILLVTFVDPELTQINRNSHYFSHP